MALLRADMLTNIQYIILIILINMINQQALFNLILVTEDDPKISVITKVLGQIF
jgi:hypothetical protein